MKALSIRGVAPNTLSRQQRVRAGATVAAVMAIVGSFVIASYGRPATLAAATATLGAPTDAAPASPTGNFSPAGHVLRYHGKAELLFVGTSGCPYCAVERWAVVKALSQFGTFSHLAATSTVGEIPTFAFDFATYHSTYVAFRALDASVAAFTRPEALVALRANPDGGTPLVAAGGYAMVGSYATPEAMSGLSFATVKRALKQGAHESFVQDVNAEANVLTALLCRADAMEPSVACDRPLIHTLTESMKA